MTSSTCLYVVDLHTCKSAANQLIRLNNVLCFEGKKSFVKFMSKFLCPLVWTFSNATSIKKIQTHQKNGTEISVQQLPVII